MPEATLLAPLASSLVGMTGAMVAGLSVYFTYKARHNQFRQVVYGRQMDAYFDITESMAALYTAAQNVLAVGNPWLRGDDARRQFRSAVRDDHDRFIATVNRALIVLPSKVKATVDHFNETVLAIGHPAESRPDGGAPAEPAAELATAYGRAVNCIRHHLAVDNLTTGMLKEMGLGSESVALKNGRSGVSPLAAVARRTR